MTKGNSKKRTRRTYSRDYKLAAVKKVIEQGMSRWGRFLNENGMNELGAGGSFDAAGHDR